jgi:hypothetical protein
MRPLRNHDMILNLICYKISILPHIQIKWAKLPAKRYTHKRNTIFWHLLNNHGSTYKTEDDLGIQGPVLYIFAFWLHVRCDKAGSEHCDGSEVGFVGNVRELRVPHSQIENPGDRNGECHPKYYSNES